MNPKSSHRHFFCITSSTLLALPSVHAADGTWLGLSGGWSDTASWTSGTIADGADFTANFTGVDINSNRTINLGDPRTIGNIVTFTFPLPLGMKNFARLKVTGP